MWQYRSSHMLPCGGDFQLDCLENHGPVLKPKGVVSFQNYMPNSRERPAMTPLLDTYYRKRPRMLETS